MIAVAIAAAAALGAPFAWAQSPPPAKVTQIFQEALVEFPGKEVRAFLVEFPPGGASVPHHHPGAILAYVLKGAWTMQMQGVPEVSLREGQVAYEHSGMPHLVSKNASATEPLKLLVFYISDPGAAVSVPMQKKH
ncbi:MAG: cupin domain-containing protein [Burkholderiales bacterium]